MATKVQCRKCPASVHSTKATWQTSFGLVHFSAVNDSLHRETSSRAVFEWALGNFQRPKSWKDFVSNSCHRTVFHLGLEDGAVRPRRRHKQSIEAGVAGQPKLCRGFSGRARGALHVGPVLWVVLRPFHDLVPTLLPLRHFGSYLYSRITLQQFFLCEPLALRWHRISRQSRSSCGSSITIGCGFEGFFILLIENASLFVFSSFFTKFLHQYEYISERLAAKRIQGPCNSETRSGCSYSRRADFSW